MNPAKEPVSEYRFTCSTSRSGDGGGGGPRYAIRPRQLLPERVSSEVRVGVPGRAAARRKRPAGCGRGGVRAELAVWVRKSSASDVLVRAHQVAMPHLGRLHPDTRRRRRGGASRRRGRSYMPAPSRRSMRKRCPLATRRRVARRSRPTVRRAEVRTGSSSRWRAKCRRPRRQNDLEVAGVELQSRVRHRRASTRRCRPASPPPRGAVQDPARASRRHRGHRPSRGARGRVGGVPCLGRMSVGLMGHPLGARRRERQAGTERRREPLRTARRGRLLVGQVARITGIGGRSKSIAVARGRDKLVAAVVHPRRPWSLAVARDQEGDDVTSATLGCVKEERLPDAVGSFAPAPRPTSARLDQLHRRGRLDRGAAGRDFTTSGCAGRPVS